MKIPKLKCLWYNRTENNLQLIEGVEDEVYQPSLLDVGSMYPIYHKEYKYHAFLSCQGYLTKACRYNLNQSLLHSRHKLNSKLQRCSPKGGLNFLLSLRRQNSEGKPCLTDAKVY